LFGERNPFAIIGWRMIRRDGDGFIIGRNSLIKSALLFPCLSLFDAFFNSMIFRHVSPCH